MQQKRGQYRVQRTILAYPQVSKASFMSYIKAVHKDDITFLEPIADLEHYDDDMEAKIYLFDR